MPARRGWLLLSPWLGLVLWPLRAPAQDVETIEITGERLDAADVQDEARAVSAFDMSDLDRANITNVDGLGYNVPSLHVGQQGNQAIITLRGIGTQNASITGEPGVQFHVDGLNYARPAAARVAFFDLESVRVVRGPHGTSGGKNATGGAIHVTTRKPAGELGVEGDYEIGSYDSRRVRAALNIPLLPEHAAARLAYLWEDHTGYQINLADPSKSRRADDADQMGLRAHLRFTPTDRFEALLSYNHYRARGVGPGAKLVGEATTVRCLAPQSAQSAFDRSARARRYSPIHPSPRPPTPEERQRFGMAQYANSRGEYKTETILPYTNGRDDIYYIRRFVNDRPQATRHTDRAWCSDLNSNYVSPEPPTEDPDDPRQVYLDMIQEQSNRIWGWGSELRWDLPELPLLGATHLIGLAGFEETRLSDPRDFDTTDLPFFSLTTVENQSRQYSGELRLESAEGERLDWRAGLYYQRETSDVLIDGLTFGTAFGLGIDQAATARSHALYGEVDLHLADSLTLTTGARLDLDYRHTRLYRANGSSMGQAGASSERICLSTLDTNLYRTRLPPGVPLRNAVPGCEDRFSRWTGGMGLEWRPADGHLLYARFDKGFKAGGFIVSDFGKYDPETVHAYTLGSKSGFLDGIVQLDVEAFYYEYRDYQYVEIDGISLRTENADEARVLGLETELDAEPWPGLRLNGQASYLNAEFTEFCSIDPMRPAEASLYREGLRSCESFPDSDQEGNELPRSPRWSYMLGLEYEIPIGRWGSLTPRIEYSWQDDTYYRAYNTPFDFQESYHRTDLKLMWTSPEQRLSAEVFVRNIEDEDVFQNLAIGSSAIGSPALAYYSAPRLYGFRVGFEY